MLSRTATSRDSHTKQSVIASVTDAVRGVLPNVCLVNVRCTAMFNNYPDILTTEQACEIMNMSRNTLYELLRSKDIKAFQVNRIWKIPREAVEEYCRRQSGLYKNTP